MTPTDQKSAARKEASWLVSRLTTTDLVLDSRQYSLLRESITDALHAKNERIRKLEEALAHMQWCRECCMDDWNNCTEGAKAAALLKEGK